MEEKDTTPQERIYNVKLTESELAKEVADLESDEELNMFLKVQNGAAKYQKYLQLGALLNRTEEVKEVPKDLKDAEKESKKKV